MIRQGWHSQGTKKEIGILQIPGDANTMEAVRPQDGGVTSPAYGSPPGHCLASERGRERTYFNFLLGPPHDKGEISPNIIISQKILSGVIKREIQQSRPTKTAPKSAASKLPRWYSLIPVDENVKDDNVPLNQTPWDLLERVTGPPLSPQIFLSLFTL